MYSLLGTSRQLNVAAEASLSLLVGQAVTEHRRAYPDIDPNKLGIAVATVIGLQVRFSINLIKTLFMRTPGRAIRVPSGFPSPRLSGCCPQSCPTPRFCDCRCSCDHCVCIVFFGRRSTHIDVASREQLVPMFGLVALEDQLRPETTLDKIIFLIEYVWTHSHKLTTLISFGVLFSLIFLRAFKEYFKRTWWIYRLPEVLLVLVASTCKLCEYL